MSLKPDESITVVARSESFVFLPFVLKNALEQISGDADVERPATARHDVSEIAALVHGLIV